MQNVLLLLVNPDVWGWGGPRGVDRGAEFVCTMRGETKQVACGSSVQPIKEHTSLSSFPVKANTKVEQVIQVTKMSPNFLMLIFLRSSTCSSHWRMLQIWLA